MELDPSAFVADPELVQELADRSLPIVCDKNRVLVHQGGAQAGLYILDRGVANITSNASQGKKAASCRAYAGSVFGLPALIFDEPATLTVVARKGAEVSFVTRADFKRLAQTDPRLSLLQVLAKEIRSLSKTVVCSKATDAVATRFPAEASGKGYSQIALSISSSRSRGL